MAGCEFALELAQDGKKVTVIEMADKLAAKCNPESRSALLLEMNKNSVKQLTNTRALEINKDGVVVLNSNGSRETVAADTVIAAFGTRSNKAEADSIKSKYPNAVTIGDCTGSVGLVGDAVHDAYEAIWLLDGNIKEKKKYLKKRMRNEKVKVKLSSMLMPLG